MRKKLLKIKFGSYVKLCSLFGLSLGFVLGILFLLLALLGGDVTVTLLFVQLHGIAGGLASIIVAPLVCYVVGVCWGVVSFLIFQLILKVIKGIYIEADWAEENVSHEQQTQ